MRASSVLCCVLPLLCAAFASGADSALPDPSFWSAALSPAGQADLARVKPAAVWQLRVRVDAAAGQLEGDADLAWRNDERVAVPDLYLQTLANGTPFKQASLGLSDIRISGVSVRSEAVAGNVATRVVLPAPLGPGGTVRLTCHFVTVPSTTGGMYGLLSRTASSWALYDWYPEVALRRDGAWAVEPSQDFTDPTRTATAHIRVELDVPDGMQAISGGTETARKASGGRTHLTIAAPFMRNLALVLGQGLKESESKVDGITVRSWFQPDDTHGGKRVLTACSGALHLFGSKFGPYPFNELDAVEVPMGDDVGGMESSGLVLMDSAPYEAVRFLDDSADVSVLPVFMLLDAAAHETGHQWWYSAVGSDPYRDPWLDEALTNWTGGYWLEQAYGAAAGTMALGLCLVEQGAEPPANPDHLPLTGKVTSYPSHDVYGAVVYGRGALFYQWLRQQMGEEQFFAFLRAWYSEQRYAITTPTVWRSTLLRFAPLPLVQQGEEKWLKGKGLTQTAMAGAAHGIAPTK